MLKRFWANPGRDPGQVLGRAWADAGPDPSRCWAEPGQMLGQILSRSGQMLGRAWADAGQILGRAWGQMLSRCWAHPGLSGSSIFTFSASHHFGTKMGPNMEPTWSQNGSQIRSEAVLEGSRSLPKNRLKNESKIDDFGGPLGPPRAAFLGTFWSQFGDFLPTPS